MKTRRRLDNGKPKGFLAWLRRLRGSSEGQGLVEFALAMPLVLFLFLGIFEFGRYYFARLTLQYAVAEAARFAITGNVLADTLGNPMSRAQSIVSVIQTKAHNMDIEVDRVTIDPSDAGGPGDVVQINADFTFRLTIPGYKTMVPQGKLDFSVSTAMKNEPFITGEP